jgi:hypothetical protein
VKFLSVSECELQGDLYAKLVWCASGWQLKMQRAADFNEALSSRVPYADEGATGKFILSFSK